MKSTNRKSYKEALRVHASSVKASSGRKYRNALLMIVVSITLSVGWLAQSSTFSSVHGSEATEIFDRAGVPELVHSTSDTRGTTHALTSQVTAPRAYVVNQNSNTVSIVETSTQVVVATVNVGTSPRNVAVTPDGTRAYVTNSGSGDISVIDTASYSVVATIPIGPAIGGVAISPNGSIAYVANNSSNLTVIDTGTNAVTTTVNVGLTCNATGVAITPDGSTVFVACHSNGNGVKVINTATNTLTATINISGQPLNVAIGNTPVGVRAYVTDDGPSNKLSVINVSTNAFTTLSVSNPTNAVAVSPNGSLAYVTEMFTSNVSVVNTTTNAITTLAAGVQPNGVAFTPDSTLAYLTNSSNEVYIFDTSTKAVVGVVNVGSSPIGITIVQAPAGLPPPNGPGPAPLAYLTNHSSSNVSVIDTGTDTLISNIRVGTTPWGVAVSSDGSRVYVTNQGSNNVSVIGTTSNSVVATVPVGASPRGIALTPDGNHAYVVNNASNNVSVIDTATNTVVATVPVGSAPSGVAIGMTSNGPRAYVTNGNSANVTVIRTDTNAVVATVSAGFGASGVDITPLGDKVYVANFSVGSVTVINTSNNTVMTTLNVGGVPRYININSHGLAYVSNGVTSPIIDTTNNTVVGTVNGFNSFDVAFVPDGARAYAADESFNDVKVVDMASDSVVNTIAIGGINPEGIAILTLPALSISDVSVAKPPSGTSNAVFTVAMSRASTRNVTVDFTTADGTAVAGVDYQSNSGTLTFAPGELVKTITVTINGDMLCGSDKDFFINLNNASNAAIADAQGVGTITSETCATPTPPPTVTPTPTPLISSSTTTTIHNSADQTVNTVDVGTTVHDLVSVTGAGPTPTGNINIDWFLNGSCSGSPAANSGSIGPLVNGQLDATGFAFPVTTAGFRAFKAHYQGDQVYLPSDGGCETLTVVDANIQLNPAAAINRVGTNDALTCHINVNDGNGFANAAAGTICTAAIVNGTGSFVGSNQCSTIGTTGDCLITNTSGVTGQTTIGASTDVSTNGLTVHRETGDSRAGDGAIATREWINAAIFIAPDATNEVGQAHTFTSTLMFDTGSGLQPAGSGQSIMITLTPANGAAPIPAGPYFLSTNGSGQVSATFTSPAPGKVTGQASWTGSVSGSPSFTVATDGVAPNSGNAVKTFVDAYIEISPLIGTDPVNMIHTYTASVFVNDGSSAVYANAPDGTQITFTVLPGSVGSFTAGSTCVTTGGSCTIDTTSTVAGDDTMQASTSLSVGGVVMTRTTGQADPGHANSVNAVEHWQAVSPTPTPTPTITPTPTPDVIVEISSVIMTVLDSNLSASLKNALNAKLKAASRAVQQGDIATACGDLQDFVDQVNALSGRKIPPDLANSLINSVSQIQAELGCGNPFSKPTFLQRLSSSLSWIGEIFSGTNVWYPEANATSIADGG